MRATSRRTWTARYLLLANLIHPPIQTDTAVPSVALRTTFREYATDEMSTDLVVMVWIGPWVVTWRQKRIKEHCRKLTNPGAAKRTKTQNLAMGALNLILAWQKWTCCCQGDELGHWAHRGKVGMRRAHWSTAIERRRSVEETEEAFDDYQRLAVQNVLEVLYIAEKLADGLETAALYKARKKIASDVVTEHSRWLNPCSTVTFNLHGARHWRGRTHRSTRDCHCCLGTPGVQSQRMGGSSRVRPSTNVKKG